LELPYGAIANLGQATATSEPIEEWERDSYRLLAATVIDAIECPDERQSSAMGIAMADP